MLGFSNGLCVWVGSGTPVVGTDKFSFGSALLRDFDNANFFVDVFLCVECKLILIFFTFYVFLNEVVFRTVVVPRVAKKSCKQDYLLSILNLIHSYYDDKLI